MSRWFRHYAGMCRDEKLVRVALKSKQPLERVVWVWCAILESAAERDDDGTFDFDADELAYFIRCEPDAINAISLALESLGRIEGNQVSSWDRRQFKADSSGERVKRYREKRREAGLVGQWQPTPDLRAHVYAKDGNACVYCGSPADLTIDHKIPEARGGTNDPSNLQTACRSCNARKRDLTHDEFVSRNSVTVTVTPHRTETELEPEEKEKTLLSEVPSDASDENGKPKKRKRAKPVYSDAFCAFWLAYPTDSLMSKQLASEVFERLDDSDRDLAMRGIPALIEHKRMNPTYRMVHAVRYLSQRRFDGLAPVVVAPTAPTFETTEDWFASLRARHAAAGAN